MVLTCRGVNLPASTVSSMTATPQFQTLSSMLGALETEAQRQVFLQAYDAAWQARQFEAVLLRTPLLNLERRDELVQVTPDVQAWCARQVAVALDPMPDAHLATSEEELSQGLVQFAELAKSRRAGGGAAKATPDARRASAVKKARPARPKRSAVKDQAAD